MLHEHPDVEFAGGFCQSPGLSTGERLRDLIRRRGVVAAPLLLVQGVSSALRWLRQPGAERRQRSNEAWLIRQLEVVDDIHDPAVLEQIKALDPDLGLIYGGPILKPQLFTIPRYGTLGIHHGRLPDYRGKKTTFWALYHGEEFAGVTIQKVNEGIDTGQMVRAAQVPARGRSYQRVEWELEELGLDRYMDAVLAVKEGTAVPQPIQGKKGRLFRDPKPRDLMRYARKRLARRLGLSPMSGDPGHRDSSVLLLTESYYPMKGGGENQARALATSVSKAGMDVRVITRRWDPLLPALALVDGNFVHRIGPTGSGHLKKWGLAWTAFPQVLAQRHRRPVLIVNGYRVLGIPATLAACFLGLRVILKADSPGEMSGEFFDPGLARFGLSHRSLPVRALVALRNRLLRSANAFVAISSHLADELRRHGVAAGRIHLIPNGVDPQSFRPPEPGERERLRQALALPLSGPLIVYTGRLVSYKGLPLLLQVWRSVAQKHPEAHLVLVGGGSADIHNCEADLRRFVQEQGLQARVSFAGTVENVAPYLRAAEGFVFPSQEEAFGLSVVEAMACGLPIVSTRTGGLADFVAEENGAITIEAGSAESLERGLERLLADDALAAELGQRARRAACDRFTMDAVRDRYLELISAGRSTSGPGEGRRS
jgi:glycosyltransferase involved in cell wall biosynthesis/folate-dependent phosphoribosylglycinamide formyltransferase PurN